MKIREILDALKPLDEQAQMVCVAPSAGLRSRISVVGQVLTNIPGAVLGDRKPYLPEKTLGAFKNKLAIFDTQFENNDFLMESSNEIGGDLYEVRYYKLTHIRMEDGLIVLHSEEDEIEELRAIHQGP